MQTAPSAAANPIKGFLYEITSENGVFTVWSFVLCNALGIQSLCNTVCSQRSIYFPDTVTSIGLRTFGYCYELTDVVLPAGLTSISEDLFLGCNKLKSVNMPEGVTSIGKSAFTGCKALSSIVIPDGVQTIGVNAFYGCTSIENISFTGTTDQWNAMSKGTSWNYNVPATYVQCSDGQVPLS